MNTEIKISKWNNSQVLVFTILFIQYCIFQMLLPIIIIGSISFLVLWLIHLDFLRQYNPIAGYANWITLLRLCLILVMGLFYKELSHIILFCLGLGNFCLDGLDGFVARKLKQQSTFGAYFDMETDAFYVCVVTLILVEKNLVNYYILIFGFMRYFYGTLVLILQRKTRDEIRTKFGPVIAGIFFIAILTPFIIPSDYYQPVLVVSSVLLMFSFTFSFVRLFSIKK